MCTRFATTLGSEFVFGQPISIDAVFADASRPLQDLLTFAEMRPSKPRGVLVTCPGLHVIAGLDSQSRLAVYRAGIGRPEMAPSADSNPYRRPVRALSCPIPFDQLVVNWFGLGKQLGPIIDLYLAIDYAPPVHMETRFINTCQAAEGYHRALSTGTVMEPSEHRAIIRARRLPGRSKRMAQGSFRALERTFVQTSDRRTGGPCRTNRQTAHRHPPEILRHHARLSPQLRTLA